jgi:hypothetical protein
MGVEQAMREVWMVIEPPRKGYIVHACAANRHAWHALCACGAARVCLRCGVGTGAIPCRCMERVKDE